MQEIFERLEKIEEIVKGINNEIDRILFKNCADELGLERKEEQT